MLWSFGESDGKDVAMKGFAAVAGIVALVLASAGMAGAETWPLGKAGALAPTAPRLDLSTADEGEQSLATQLSNPVSSLISVPFQLNYNQGLGTGDGTQTLSTSSR